MIKKGILTKEDCLESSNEVIQLGSYYGNPLFWRLVNENDDSLTYISDVIDILKDFDIAVINGSFNENEKKIIMKDSKNNYAHFPSYEEISKLFNDNDNNYLAYATENGISKGAWIITEQDILDEVGASNNDCPGYFSEDDVKELLKEVGSCPWYFKQKDVDMVVDIGGHPCEMELLPYIIPGVRVVINLKKEK